MSREELLALAERESVEDKRAADGSLRCSGVFCCNCFWCVKNDRCWRNLSASLQARAAMGEGL